MQIILILSDHRHLPTSRLLASHVETSQILRLNGSTRSLAVSFARAIVISLMWTQSLIRVVAYGDREGLNLVYRLIPSMRFERST